jgi:hypothetical protein
MIPLWSMALSVATGNSLILKPSERDPGCSSMLVELLEKAGASIISFLLFPLSFFLVSSLDRPVQSSCVLFLLVFSFPISARLTLPLPPPGLPKGVVSVVNGTIPPVKFICEDKRIKVRFPFSPSGLVQLDQCLP